MTGTPPRKPDLIHIGPAPRIAVETTGSGPLVVFLHGIGGNRTNWADQIAVFATRYRAASWDARGYGDSDDYDGPLTFGDFASDLLRVIDFFGAGKAHLVGLSMGGRIAQDFCRRHRERVASLVLCDTHRGFGDLTERQRTEYIDARRTPLLAGKKPRDIAPGLVARLAGPNANERHRARLTASISALRVESYLKSIEATVRQDRLGRLDDLGVPVHCVVGEHDALTTPALMAVMAREAGAALTTIPGAGHLSNIENPDAFNRAVLAFLDSVAL